MSNMEKDQGEIEVGSDLGNNSTTQEKTSKHSSSAEECRYEEITRAIKEGKPFKVTWQIVPMRTLELMKERGLLILDDDDEPTEEEKLLERDTSGSSKRRRVGQEHSGSDLKQTGSGEEIVLPFTKTLDSWKEYELNEFYNRTPQRPHFRPLFYSRPYFREWVALSLTMTFIELTKIVDDIGEDTPRSTLDDYKQTSEMLEEHGFDVKAPLSRIKELLSVVKNGLKNILAEQKGVEKGV